jgi:hypothetical protein
LIVLTDAAAEGDHIHTTQVGRHRPDALQQAVAKHGKGETGAVVAVAGGLAQLAHIGAEASGEPQQATRPLQPLLQLLGGQALPQQLQQHTGVNRAAAGGHHQALQGRVTHGGGHTAAIADGAERAPRAQMATDQP